MFAKHGGPLRQGVNLRPPASETTLTHESVFFIMFYLLQCHLVAISRNEFIAWLIVYSHERHFPGFAVETRATWTEYGQCI